MIAQGHFWGIGTHTTTLTNKPPFQEARVDREAPPAGSPTYKTPAMYSKQHGRSCALLGLGRLKKEKEEEKDFITTLGRESNFHTRRDLSLSLYT